MFLTVLAILSNSGEDGATRIEQQMFLMNCPMPIYNGDVSNLDIIGFGVNYTVTYYSSVTDFNGTFFQCSLDSITGAFTVSAISKPYDATVFSVIPIGWYGYLADFFVALFARLEAFFILVSFFVSPTNFNILGITISDLTGVSLMLVISLYALCYIAVGAMTYKLLSPFSGVG